MPKFIDLTGKRFGRLIVLGLDKEKSTTKVKYWICRCDCGNIISVRGGSLTCSNRHTRSCGCLNKEIVAKLGHKNTKSNEIIIRYELGYAEVYFNNCDEYFKCDIEDLDIVRQYCWRKNPQGYAIADIKREFMTSTKTKILFHRLVMEKYFGDISEYLVDHFNHDTLDNRKDNLRICNRSENNRNRIPLTNTGKKYISYLKNIDKYQVKVPNDITKIFNNYSDACTYTDEYLSSCNDKYVYNPLFDVKNRSAEIISPFIDYNTGETIKREIIQPFKFPVAE